ncbi:MAG: sarcosine oxidase subunit gamma [Roseibium sp.]|uniref:sarcosine oxidase subunit gamma n=1 Tax=Roseibium sp. TaxID=1936156 RepID=UPI00261EEB70|nr:sarcosine oxidase subunit gamma [Roseibium sp.]MCV0429428.1 sarcosine oxidase subunit gamma [Roseibium sp.]
MSDYHLKAASALGGAKHQLIQIGDYQLQEISNLAIASVASRTGESERVASILQEVLGATAPGPGTVSTGQGGLEAFWTGPDQWMVCAPHDDRELLARELKEIFADTASITEQNDAWVCLEVSGPDLVPVFERLAAFDIDRFHQGSAVRTVIEHIGCFVLCMETRRKVRIFAGRSFAHSLHHALKNNLTSTVALQAIS